MLKRLSPRKGKGISIIIPFRCLDSTHPRMRNIQWLKKYWKSQLPAAELIIGEDPDTNVPFSKSVAINNGVREAKGDILVVVDADGYLDIDSVLHCAKEIRDARKLGHKLWFVPYRLFHRLTESASQRLLASNPKKPLIFSTPPGPEDRFGNDDASTGHWYGAMIQIMPKEAFEIVGGWDPLFRGWGGEDHAAMRAMDTLYSSHKTLPGQVLHVWHPQIGNNGSTGWVPAKERRWEGQNDPAINSRLSWRYYWSAGRPGSMRRLLDEGFRWYEAHRHEYLERKQQNLSEHHHSI